MKWTPQDIDVFLESKEFVDTALLVLTPISFSHEMRQAAMMNEIASMVITKLERQFTGRVLLLPGFTYLATTNEEKLVSDLVTWEAELTSFGFSHIFYLTSDLNWKAREDQLAGTVFSLPDLQIDSIQESDKMASVEAEVKQLQTVFIQKWREKA